MDTERKEERITADLIKYTTKRILPLRLSYENGIRQTIIIIIIIYLLKEVQDTLNFKQEVHTFIV